MQNTTAQRLDWIDAFKGICIIEIVLMHIHYMWEEGIMPEWILVPYFVPAFFFISGTFHKDRSIKEIIRQKSNTLLVPFVLWYALALILRLVTMMHSKGWDYIQQVWASDGAMAFKYQSIDGALWFLLALFEMCLFAKVLSYLKKKWLILVVSFPCAACGMLMMAKVLPQPDTYGIIPIAEVLWFQVFYILGMLWGKPVLNMIQREWNKTKIVYFGVALSFVFAVNILPITESPLNLIPHMGWQAPAALCFIFCALQFCFWFSMYTPPIHYGLRFFGYYSLIVLAIHMPLFSTFYHSAGWDKTTYCTLFTTSFFILLIPFCLLAEQYLPALLGRKQFF